MKKTLKILFIMVTVFMVFTQLEVVYAENYNETDFYDEAVEASGANELEQSYSEDVRKFFQDHDLSLDNPSGITSLNPKAVFNNLIEKIKESAYAPLKLLLSMLAVVMLSALVENIGGTTNSESVNKIYNIITILVCVLLLSEPVCVCIEQTSEALSEGATFMLGFVPVFSSITAGSGGFTSAGSYNIIVVLIAEIAVQFASEFLMPLLSLCMALAIVDSINPAVSLSGMIDGIKKCVVWCLGFVMTVFVGLLSIQSIIGNSADTLSVKTAKFMVSNLVPVVGGAVSDAYTTLKGSLGLLKGGVGGIGIIVIIIMVLPTIITVLLYRGAIGMAGICADIFNAGGLNKLFKNISSVMSIAFSIIICFTLMFIISTAIIMALVQ